MYVPNSTTSAYQLDRYIEKKVDKKAELELKKQKKRLAARRKLAMYMAVVFAILFVLLLRYVRIYDLHSEVAGQSKSLETIRMENQQTELTIENMTDKAKIQEYAETKLGLRKMTDAQIIYLNPQRENHMENYAKSNSAAGGIKGVFAGFWEYLK